MTQGILGRPPIHLPRVLEYLEQNGMGPDKTVHVKDIAFALELRTTQITSTLGNHIAQAGPKAQAARVKVGVYRWVSPAERARKNGRAKIKAARTVGEAILNDEITAKDGWVAPATNDLSIPAMNIKRGGIQFPPALVAGLTMEDAVVAHTDMHLDEAGQTTDVYFVWRGKMWKAYQI